ncbi:MAG: hypothetical protein ACOCOP_08735 [Prevotella sp.]
MEKEESKQKKHKKNAVKKFIGFAATVLIAILGKKGYDAKTPKI